MCRLFSLSPCQIKEQPYGEAILLSVSVMKSSQNNSSLTIKHRLSKPWEIYLSFFKEIQWGKLLWVFQEWFLKSFLFLIGPPRKLALAEANCLGSTTQLLWTSHAMESVPLKKDWCSRIQASPVQLYWIRLS